MFSDQLAIEPMSAAASSTRYRFQVPFADSPSKTDRLTFPDGTGAGAGKVSVPGSKSAGRQEPDVICAESGSWLSRLVVEGRR